MAISDENKYLLDNRAGKIFNKVKLGTLIRNAEEGGLADDAISVEHLDDGILPSHVTKFAGTHTTAGGDAAETIAAAGVVATDIVMVLVKTAGASPVTVAAAAAGTDQIDVTMSADPSTDHVLQYLVLRAAS